MLTSLFEPRVSIVTGAAGEVAQALAVELWRRGSHVVLADVDEDEARRVVDELGGSAGPGVVAAGADPRDARALRALVEDTAAEHGCLDVMVNTTAAPGPGDGAGLAGVVNGCRAAFSAMRHDAGGFILNVAAPTAERGLDPVSRFSRTFRSEVAAFGVVVTCACPAVALPRGSTERFAAKAIEGLAQRRRSVPSLPHLSLPAPWIGWRRGSGPQDVVGTGDPSVGYRPATGRHGECRPHNAERPR